MFMFGFSILGENKRQWSTIFRNPTFLLLEKMPLLSDLAPTNALYRVDHLLVINLIMSRSRSLSQTTSSTFSESDGYIRTKAAHF